MAYLRVSTDAQGRSGLGLEAQRGAVARHVASIGGRIVAELVEVESGRKQDRPQLAAALEACRRHRAALVIAKLDRLARNVAFVSNLMESGVEFVAADMPAVNRLTVHILAAVAEEEARMISARTKAALAAAKAQGVKLGGAREGAHRFTPDHARRGNAISVAERGKAAQDMARRLGPELQKMRREGLSLAKMANRLNAEEVSPPRGGQWHAMTVKRVLARAGLSEDT